MTDTSIWEHYYDKPENRRRFPDEDLCRFLSMARPTIVEKPIIVDFGCGDGRNGLALDEFYPEAEIFGSDLNVQVLRCVEVGAQLYDFVYPMAGWRTGLESILNKYFCSGVTMFVDCMTSQHFSWAEHDEYLRLVASNLRPGGWFFLKHLNWDCSDTGLIKAEDQYHCTYRNIPNVPLACYPDNGVVCMPNHWDLHRVLKEAGLSVMKQYELVREEFVNLTDYAKETKRFAHSVFFCQKPEQP